jgi:hypothetical protein
MPATTEVRPTMTWRPTIIRKSRDIEGIGSPATLGLVIWHSLGADVRLLP